MESVSRTGVMTMTAVAVCLAIVGCSGDSPTLVRNRQSSARSTTETAVVLSPGAIRSGRDGRVVITRGLVNGKPWEVSVSGTPPDTVNELRVAGQFFASRTSAAHTWSDGRLLGWAFASQKDALLVFGEVPIGTNRVQIDQGGGFVQQVSPAGVWIDRPFTYFAVALPGVPQHTVFRAVDDHGQTLAEQRGVPVATRDVGTVADIGVENRSQTS
jgi:hypothetical protein